MIYALCTTTTYNFTAIKMVLLCGEKTPVTKEQADYIKNFADVQLFNYENEEKSPVKTAELIIGTKKFEIPNSYTRTSSKG